MFKNKSTKCPLSAIKKKYIAQTQGYDTMFLIKYAKVFFLSNGHLYKYMSIAIYIYIKNIFI